MSEIDKFPRAVLKHHYPDTPLHGDFTTIKKNEYEPIELLVGGTPCQSFSIAGLRKGMADDRGNLALEFIKLAQRLRPRWLVWENVPGVLSSNKGRDFGAFLGGLAEVGYGFAYRVLDAQYIRVESHPYAVPQRRRRVFVIGYFGDWRPAAAVLFERERLQRHPPPSRKKGKRVATPLTPGTRGPAGDEAYNLIPWNIMPMNSGKDFKARKSAVEKPLTCNGNISGDQGGDYVVYDTTQITSPQNGDNPKPGICHPIKANAHVPLLTGQAVRRLTPLECERLQGFPEVRNYAYIKIWLDHQKGCVNVGIKCHRKHINASNVGGDDFYQFVKSAEKDLSISQADQERLVALSAPIKCDQKEAQGNNPVKFPLFAASADQKRWCRRHIVPENTAHPLAHMLHDLVSATLTGKGGSRLSIKHSTPQGSGKGFAELFINGSVEYAKDATSVRSEDNHTHTISALGQLIPKEGSTLETVLCSVLRATAGYIPKKTKAESFCIAAESKSHYTLIEYGNRKRPLKDFYETVLYLESHGFSTEEAIRLANCPDGPRYKALGNSMAVNVMSWVGQRIQKVNDML